MKKLGTLLLTLCMILSLLLVPVQAGACETQMSVAVAQMDAIEASNASWSQTDPQTQAGLLIVEAANHRIEEIIVEISRYRYYSIGTCVMIMHIRTHYVRSYSVKTFVCAEDCSAHRSVAP